MAELVTTPPTEGQAQETAQTVTPKTVGSVDYGRIMAAQSVDNPSPSDTSQTVQTETQQTQPPVAQAEAQTENWFSSEAPALEETPAAQEQAQVATVYQQVATELGIELPQENQEEFILTRIKGIREAVQSDPYRQEEQIIAQNNYKLGLTDDQLLFLDKSQRLGQDLTPEQIDEIIDGMSPDQFKREVETIRKSLEGDNTQRQTNKLNIEKQTAEQLEKTKKEAATQIAEQTRIFKEAVQNYKLDGEPLSPRVIQEITKRVLSGDVARYLNSPEGLIHAAMAMSDLREMYLSNRDSKVAAKAVSDSLKKLDGQSLNIGGGNFATAGIRTVGASEYGQIKKQQ